MRTTSIFAAVLMVAACGGKLPGGKSVPGSDKVPGGGGVPGTPAVLSDQGLSFGGNGLVIVNAELRTTVGKLFGRDFGVVQFVDAGNIFAKMSDISLAQLRTSLGLGIRYDSPVGPLRLDFGFKTSRLVFNGVREHGWEYHVSFGQVF